MTNPRDYGKMAGLPCTGSRKETEKKSLKEKKFGPALFVAAAALLMSTGGLFIKMSPWNGFSINGARCFFAIFVVGAYLALTHHPLKFNRWVLLGSVFVSGTCTLYSLANTLTTAANTIVLQFTAPIFVMVLQAVFWKKRPAKLQIVCSALVLTGVAFFFVDGLSAGNLLGNLLALGAGLSYAGVFLLNELPDADPISSVFFADILSAAAGLPFLFGETDFGVMAWTSVILLGVFQVGLAYVFMCKGLQGTPAVTASLITGIEPILNPILVAVFFHETVGLLALPGAVIVIGTVLYYNVHTARKA